MKKGYIITLLALGAVATCWAIWTYSARRERLRAFEHTWTCWRAEDVYRAARTRFDSDQEFTLTAAELADILDRLWATPPDMVAADRDFANGTFIVHPRPPVIAEQPVVAIWLPPAGSRLPALGVLRTGGCLNLERDKRELEQWIDGRGERPTTIRS